MNNYTALHTHSDKSNTSVQFVDSICSVEQIVEQAHQLGLYGVALTDHETLAGHVEMYKLQEKYPDMKLILGNEIYCMSEEQLEDKKNEDNLKCSYYHLILIALDIIGWRQLCKLSTYAWINSFNKRGVRRITTKEYIKEIISENPGHIICSSACMGGEVSKLLMENKVSEAKRVVKEFQDIFGEENYYLEIQPNEKETHQWESNQKVIKLAKELSVPLIATTDSHMLSKDERQVHAVAKNSKWSEDAEGEDFYATAYMMNAEELRKYLKNNLTDKQIDEVFNNTNKICDRVQGYDGILHNQIIPEIPKEYIPEFTIEHRFKKWYDKYPYIKMFSEKDYLQERYAFYQIEQGLIKRILNTNKSDRIEAYLERINRELDIIAEIDKNLGTKIITYYSTYTFMIDEIWKLGSVVAVGRGSACSWLINYIMGANQIDPLDSPMSEMLFPERHLNKLRFELPDCDFDTSPLYRQKIINRFKEIWGDDRVLQVSTFGTLKPKAVIKRACKGLGVDDDEADTMSALVPVVRGEARPLSVCLDENSSGKVPELIDMVKQIDGLKEIVLRLEGVVSNLGTHAGGVCFYNEPYVNELASVRSPSGVLQTCFDLHDAEATGTTKFDTLTTKATELIRKELEILVKEGYIEDKGSLRETYQSVIGVENLEYNDEEMWSKALEVPQLFQFETAIGKAILKKMNAKSIEELCAASSLMRLLPQGFEGGTPADKYIEYRDNIENFHRDAARSGLNEKEISIIESVCKSDGYMTLHQETLMLLSMHPGVAGFSYAEANKLRKSVAGKNHKAQQEMKDKFFEWCEKQGTRKEFASYVWNKMFSAQLGYAFSAPHVLAYGLVALQELNLYHRFPKEYWYASVLDTEGIAKEDSSGGGTDYTKITKAIYGLYESNVKVMPPAINKADVEFAVDVDKHQILYALSSIPLINNDDIEIIKSQRPYKNMKDFVERSQFTKSKIINLIKAGCFGNAKQRMKVYAKILASEQMPSKMGLTQAKKYPQALDNREMQNTMTLLLTLKGEEYFVGTRGNKKVYQLPEIYIRLCDNLKYDQDWWQDGDDICITDKGIDKALKKQLDEIKSYVKTEEFAEKFNECLAKDIYNDLTKGNNDTKLWQFEATGYYHDENIFSDNVMKKHGWVNFEDMPTKPDYTEREGKHGKTWREYTLYSMPITVVGKNDIRHTIYGLTADNQVVSVKMQDGEYVYYKSKTKSDVNWFERGTLLILHGYRTENDKEFRLKRYPNGVFEHTIYKIQSINNTKVEIKTGKS